jgi:hypothetical protein
MKNTKKIKYWNIEHNLSDGHGIFYTYKENKFIKLTMIKWYSGLGGVITLYNYKAVQSIYSTSIEDLTKVINKLIYLSLDQVLLYFKIDSI